MEFNWGGANPSISTNSLVPDPLAGSILDQTAALESDGSLRGLLSTIEVTSKSAFKEPLPTEIALHSTGAESESISSSSSEMAWNEASGILQTFLNPVATSLASSVETLDEVSNTSDPVTGVSASAQLVGGNIQVTPPIRKL